MHAAGRSLACLVLAILLPMPGSASPLAHLLSTLKTSDQYRQAQAEVEAAEHGVDVSEAERKLTVHANVAFRLDKPDTPTSGKTPSRLNQQLTASAPLINLAADEAINIAKLSLELARLNSATVRQQIMLNTYRTYLAATLAQDRLNLLDRRRTNLEEQFRFATTAFEVGKGSRLDILNVESQLAALKAERIAAKSRILTARRTLSSVSGRLAGNIAHLTKAPSLPAGDAASWTAQASQNLAVQAATTRIQVQQATTQQLRGRILPALDFVVGSDLQDEHSFSLQLNVPLYSSGGATAGLARAGSQEEAQVAARDQFLADARLAAANAFEDLLLQRERSAALAANVALAAERLDLAKASIELRAGTLTDALRAEADLAVAELQQLEARHAQLEALLQLLVATGKLNLEQARRLEHLFL